MKRIVCLIIGIILLFGTGCTTVAAKTADQAQTRDALIAAYSQAIAQQGFSFGQVGESSGDDSVAYDIFSDAFPDGTRVWFKIQEVDQAVQATGIEFYHPDSKPADLKAFITLSQTLLQVCSPSTIPDQVAAKETLKAVFQSCMQGDLLEKNGFRYAAFGEGIDATKFAIIYPGHEEEEGTEKTTTVQGTKAFDFTAEEVAAMFGKLTAKTQISVKPAHLLMSSIPELSKLPKEDSPKVYALEHGLGITVGWLVFYSSDAGVVQLNYVERNDGDLQLYLIQMDLADALVQACDPVFSLKDTKENQEKVHEVASDFFDHDPITENGIQYQEFNQDGASFIIVTKS